MAGKDDSQSSGGGSRKSTPATKPQEQAIKCPRCDSSNTKFCYYNNYSLTQPRHFCKTCRRYWTNGGALRNVPIGGGCRKNKKMKSSTAVSRLSIDSKDNSTRSLSEIAGGLKYFQGIISPTIDFQLAGGGLNYPRVINSSNYNNNDQFPSSFGDISMSTGPIVSNPCFNHLDPSASSSNQQMGFNNFPFSTNYQTNLASSIESLSSINQDLHYKLQQQRMAMLLSGDSQKEIGFSSGQIQKPQPILFHNLEASRTEGSLADHLSRKEVGSPGNLATEWFFDPTPTSSSGINNENVTSTWNGIQAWSNLNQFSPLP